ncbi:MAG: PTS sugar transporter subunit IIA [Treponema sp.]|nr:PTS sugar transporter subunit IIA [Treponema sp.]
MLSDDILTIEEVANYLRVSERTVYEWAQRGEIPAGKIGNVWRFKKPEIERWVNDRLLNKHPSSTVPVARILSPDRIVFLNSSSKQDVLVALCDNLAAAPQIKNREELLTEIIKRDELMSTAIGRGIAIPHVRLSSVTDLVAAVGVSGTDIADFQTLDDEPVRLVIMIAAAYSQHAYYLQTLSYFSSRLKNSQLRCAIMDAQEPLEVYRLLASESQASTTGC